MADLRVLLADVAERVADYRERVADTAVYPPGDAAGVVRARLGTLRTEPTAPAETVAELVEAVTPGLVATTGPRFFGFVVGGALPAATAADMLAVGWDQIAFNAVSSPAAAVTEEVAGGWLKDLLGIPRTASVGFVTGAPGGQHRRAGRGPPPGARRRRLGRRAATGCSGRRRCG